MQAALSRQSTCLNIPSARLNTGRSSILTARTVGTARTIGTAESVSKIDDILDNIKK